MLQRETALGLVAVDVIDAPRSNAVLEMSVTDGITIRLREDVSVETLERVLRAAGRHCQAVGVNGREMASC